MAFSAGAIFADLVLKTGQWDTGIKKIQTDLKKSEQNIEKSQEKFGKLGETLSGVGVIATAFSVAITAIGTASIMAANEFNKSMANIATLIDNPNEKIDGLKGNVQDLAVKFGTSTKDMSGGLYQVISAFEESDDQMKILETNAMAAAAGLATTTDAINLTSAVTKGYNDVTAEAVQKASDLAFITVKLGQTTFPELSQGIGKVVSSANTLGISQEELFAGFAALTGVTGNTREVSTQYAAVLNSLIKPTDGMAEAMETLGYTSSQTMISELGLKDALTKLVGTTDGSAESTGKLFESIESLRFVFAATGAQSSDYDRKLNELKDSTGATEDAFKDYSDGIYKAGFTMDQVKAKIQVLGQNFGDTLAPAIAKILDLATPFIDFMSGIFKAFTQLPQPVQTVAVGFGALVVAAGPMLLIGGKMMVMFAAMPAKIAAIGLALGKVTLAFTAAVVAGLALSSAFKKLGDSHDAAMKKMVDENDKGAASIKKYQEFYWQASDKVKAKMSEMKARYTANGADFQKSSEYIINVIRGQSEEFREWEKKQVEAHKKVGDAAEEGGSRVVNAVNMTNLEIAELGQEELDRLAEAAEFRTELLLAEQEGIREAEMIAAEDSKLRQENAFAAYMKLRELRISAMKDEMAQIIEELSIRYAQEKEEIEKNTQDHAQRAALLQALEKDHAVKVDKVKADFDQKERERRTNNLMNWMDTAGKALNLLDGLFGAFYDKRIAELESEYDKRRQWIEDNVADEDERATQIAALEAELAQKKKEAAITAAKAAKAAAILSIVVDTAKNIVKAFPNIGQMVAAGVLGGIQLATAMAAPIPQLAEGGITSGQTQAVIGDNPSGVEMVLPLEKAEEMGFGGSGQQMTFNIYALDTQSMVDAVHNKIIPILQKASRTGNFEIDAMAVRSF